MNALGRSLMRVREQLCIDVPIVVKKRSYPMHFSPTVWVLFFVLWVICVTVLFVLLSGVLARWYHICIFCSFVRLLLVHYYVQP